MLLNFGDAEMKNFRIEHISTNLDNNCKRKKIFDKPQRGQSDISHLHHNVSFIKKPALNITEYILFSLLFS